MVPTLAYFYILCNNKNYKKASGFLRQGVCTGHLNSSFEDRRGIGKGNNQQGFEVKKVLSGKSAFPPLTDHKKTINLWRVNK